MFVHIHTPIITSSDCEGAGEVFSVQPASTPQIKDDDENDRENEPIHTDDDAKGEENYFGRDVYLTVSGQLHLEAICNGISPTYNFSPVFRAENGKSRKHLSEFWMVEAEVGFAHDLKTDVIDLMESLVKTTISTVLESNHDDLQAFTNLNQDNTLTKHTPDLTLLANIADNHTPFIIMSYNEAMNLLIDRQHHFKSRPQYGKSFGNEHELYLVETYCNNVPIHIIDWPKSTKPFYCRTQEFNSHNDNDTLVSAVDLLFPKIGELCGGALREYRSDILRMRMDEVVAKNNKLINTLEWYLKLRSDGGSAPTGGFGLGFDRLIQFILGINNIRDVMPFPRTPHKCRL